MAEYIEREALLNALCTVSAPTPTESWIVEKCIEKVNEALAAADVVEVKRGRWKLLDGAYSLCTNCKYERSAATQYGWNFCPNCGADMREVDHG